MIDNSPLKNSNIRVVRTVGFRKGIATVFLSLMVFALFACGGGQESTGTPSTGASGSLTGPAATGTTEKTTIILAAYTTPREAYRQIIPLFQKQWKEKTGQDVEFQESYLGSGAQSRAVVGGFEADLVALSLEADVNRIANADLITHDWKSQGAKGMVSDSLVVFAVREGNPKNIRDWKDLTQPGLEILTPDPASSGGAQWNIMAAWGAARRGFVDGYAKDDDNAARQFLNDMFMNVTVLDKGARESITNFEQGVGDVAITYENEVLVALKGGQNYDFVIPRSTILVENPVAVVDAFVDKHGTREVAEAFRDFLFTPEAQTIFAEHGLRSVDPTVAKAMEAQFPAAEDLFTIEDLGGWKTVTPTFFGPDGTFTQLLEQVQTQK